MPVVVRSVEVDRVNSDLQGSFGEIFNVPTDEDAVDNKIPIISEIESRFTVTLEFIEVISSPAFKEEVL